MAQVWEKSYPSGVHSDYPLPPAVPLEGLLETAATTRPDARLHELIHPHPRGGIGQLSIFTIAHSLIANYTIWQQKQRKVCRHLV
jgi:hypothetical protein